MSESSDDEQDDSVMLQRDTLPIQVLNKLMDWIMDGR